MKYLYEGFGNYHYKHAMVAATATMVIYNETRKAIWVGRRSAKSDAYPNKIALPGGFLEPGKETVEECASRELHEETNVDIAPQEWQLFAVYSGPELDPRAHVVNTCFYVSLPEERYATVNGGDDLPAGFWLSVEEIENSIPADDWAFNHKQIIADGIRKIYQERT